MRKHLLIAVLIVCLCASLAGCFRSWNQPAATPTPVPTAGMTTVGPTVETSPGASMAPAGTAQPSSSPTTTDWAAQGTAVEARINMLSEIQESRVVVADNTALVGVKFTSAYQGEMTQRIRDMIAGEVMAVDSSIQVVAVTSEPADVETIYQLSDKQRGGASMEEIKPEVEKIAKNATTLR